MILENEVILEDPMVSSDGPICSARKYLTQRNTEVEDASRTARTCLNLSSFVGAYRLHRLLERDIVRIR